MTLQVKSTLELDNLIEMTECIHAVDYKTLYLSYHKESQTKMVTKLLDLRKLKDFGKEKEGSIKSIKHNCI